MFKHRGKTSLLGAWAQSPLGARGRAAAVWAIDVGSRVVWTREFGQDLSTGVSAGVWTLCLDPTGRIYVASYRAGRGTQILRLLSSGATDGSFNTPVITREALFAPTADALFVGPDSIGTAYTKLDGDGNLVWESPSGVTPAEAIQFAAADELYSFEPSTNPGAGLWRLDQNGDVVWDTDGTSADFQNISGVDVLDDETVVGLSAPGPNYRRIFTINRSTGALVDVRNIDPSRGDKLIVHAGKIVLGCDSTASSAMHRLSTSLTLEETKQLPDHAGTASLTPGPGGTIFAVTQENGSVPSRVYQIDVSTLDPIWSWEIPLVEGGLETGRGLRACRWDGDAQRLYVVGDRISRWSDDAS